MFSSLFGRTSEDETLLPKPNVKSTSWNRSSTIFGNHAENNRKSRMVKVGCVIFLIGIGVVLGIVFSVKLHHKIVVYERAEDNDPHHDESNSTHKDSSVMTLNEMDISDQSNRQLSGDDCTIEDTLVWTTTQSSQSRIYFYLYDCDDNLLIDEGFLGNRVRYTETDDFCINSFDGTYKIVVTDPTYADSVDWTWYDASSNVVASGIAPANINTCTDSPSHAPVVAPTPLPTTQPTPRPTSMPVFPPSPAPTAQPTPRPTSMPVFPPSPAPTAKPTPRPTSMPVFPPSPVPTAKPTPRPSHLYSPTPHPSPRPSAQPTQPTFHPTLQPVPHPTRTPTHEPSANPTERPTHIPSRRPTKSPTSVPTTTDTVGVDVSFDMTGATYVQPTDQDVADLRSVLEAQLLPSVGSSAVLRNLAVTSSSSLTTFSSTASQVLKGEGLETSKENMKLRKLATYTWSVSFSVEISLSSSTYTSATAVNSAVETAASSSEVSSGISSSSIGGGVAIDESTLSTALLSKAPTSMPTRSGDDDEGGSHSGGGATTASVGAIIGIILGSFSVVYCCMLYQKKIMCQADLTEEEEEDNYENSAFATQQRAIRSRRASIKCIRFSEIATRGSVSESKCNCSDEMDNTCAICICDMEPEDLVKQLPNCMHCYHKDCLDEWLGRSNLCPLCKGEVVPTLSQSNTISRRANNNTAAATAGVNDMPSPVARPPLIARPLAPPSQTESRLTNRVRQVRSGENVNSTSGGGSTELTSLRVEVQPLGTSIDHERFESVQDYSREVAL